jgi:Protein of unknown function (DUF3891)
MIIAESSEHYRMITQNDHGDLAGQFAAHWGNEQFARLRPYSSMVLAAEATITAGGIGMCTRQ